jgi:hypothetical protein
VKQRRGGSESNQSEGLQERKEDLREAQERGG